MVKIRGMIQLSLREGPIYVQPHAITSIQPVKNGCRVGIAFLGEVVVMEGIDSVKHKLENGDEPQ